ncbi:MAG: alpha/beta hydrolase [Spirochaetales bacterium]|nr:alpha/beta hydrolase [Candidatus Physcosoma equi]
MARSKALIYMHGKGGSPEEAERLRPVLPSYDVYGVTVEDFTPWGSRRPLLSLYESLERKYGEIYLLGNSIGAYFSMLAFQKRSLKKALFVSPVLDMERLISDMMAWSGVTEAQLQEERIIHTSFGEDLSWDYLSFVRQHPVSWSVPTAILYASGDALISQSTIDAFVSSHIGTSLTVMEKGGEHWFHTEQQLETLDAWLKAELED